MLLQAQLLARDGERVLHYENCEINTEREAADLRLAFECIAGDAAAVRLLSAEAPLALPRRTPLDTAQKREPR